MADEVSGARRNWRETGLLSGPGLVFAAALLTSSYIWWLIAWPVLSGRLGPHVEHGQGVMLHAIGGTMMLVFGSLALHVGWTRRWFRRHRLFGYLYLAGGTATSVAALGLNALNPHDDFGIGVATSSLAAAWLAVSFMAWRAARNRRIDVHRDWVLRSYVLTWTFVLCRLVQRTPVAGRLGEDGPVALIWLTWVGPLLICEMILQWRRTGPVTQARLQ